MPQVMAVDFALLKVAILIIAAMECIFLIQSTCEPMLTIRGLIPILDTMALVFLTSCHLVLHLNALGLKKCIH
jgi:hypothetical protein